MLSHDVAGGVNPPSFMYSAKQLWQREGLRGLYRGMSVQLTMRMFVGAFMLSTELLIDAMGQDALRPQ